MDDTCAVCAESLEWVAYGACGHKDVCSTCVARLRFICDDRRCCICKADCNVVFVTKALGDYTERINDFGVLPLEAKEGRVGQYWYHEDTEAFFDDSDHYKMIKAMCLLSCSQCDNEDQPDDVPRRRPKFGNIEQLKGHLFHKHGLFMCSLCLEGRKVFVCEQKLYTRSQLVQHVNTGDSEVDGNENERGGFMGHPMCESCRMPFYGDNELYTHMSTEHYTCHICQRQHPGQYEYFKDYDDLEMHFRWDHFLCEDEGCLAKKFLVFQSKTALKRHNAEEHGGHMPLPQRISSLQVPTSFRNRWSFEQYDHCAKGHHAFDPDPVDSESPLSIQASLKTGSGSASTAHGVFDQGNAIDDETLIPPVESLCILDSEQSSRYRQDLSRSGTLRESFFPMPVASVSNQPNLYLDLRPDDFMVVRLRGPRNQKVNASNPASAPRACPPLNSASGSSSTPSTSSVSGYSTSPPTSSQIGNITSGIVHCSSAPDLPVRGCLQFSIDEFPPLQTRKPPSIDQAITTKAAETEDILHHSANKSLLEQIRAAVVFDGDKFAAFEGISGEYRQGLMDVEIYLAHVEQFGLGHLVLDLSRLLPNSQKQKELIDAYNRFTLAKNAALKEKYDNRKLLTRSGNGGKKNQSSIGGDGRSKQRNKTSKRMTR